MTVIGKTLDAGAGTCFSRLDVERIGAGIAGLIKTGSPLSIVLETLCRLVDADLPGCASGVALAHRSGMRVKHVVGPGLPSGYKEWLEHQTFNGLLRPNEKPADVVLEPDLRQCSIPPESKALASVAFGFCGCRSSPVRSLTGEPLGLITICQVREANLNPFDTDLLKQLARLVAAVIERARSQESLRRGEAMLAKIQRLSSTGTFLWRVVTDELVCSDEVYRIFELDRSPPVTLELVGSRVHPEEAPSFFDAIERARWTVSDFELEHRLQMPDRSVKYLRILMQGSLDHEGELEYTGAIHDLTQSRFAEKALSKLRSELAHLARVTSLGALSASIAHEVNQPLFSCITNVSTCVRMLDECPLDIDGARETARRAIRDGRRASEVITTLRALFVKRVATTESVNLNEAAREVMALASSELRRNRVAVRTQFAENLPTVVGDRVQLQQVILNLILNALDAMAGINERPRRLMIKTELDQGDRIRLLVKDSGIGFQPQDLEQLFEAFHTTKGGGMGIGLSVSRSIIESHQGCLWGRPNEDVGATFCFSIPIAASDGTTGQLLVCDSNPADGLPVARNA